MANVTNLINQVRDPSVRRALQALFDQLKADLAANKTVFDAHTHRGDGAQVGQYNTSTPQSDAETVVQVTASAFVNNLE